MARETLEDHLKVIENVGRLGLIDEIVDFQPYIGRMAKYLPNEGEAMMRFATGLEVLADALVNSPTYQPLAIAYQVLASLSAIHASEHNVDVDAYNPINLNLELKFPNFTLHEDQLLTIDQAVQVARFYEEKGFSIGLVHGHFRLLTPSSIAFLINAFEHARVVLTGLETGDRTEQFKQKENILDDDQRAQVFRVLTPFPFFIDKSIPYTNEGYTRLVQQIGPHKYIGQSWNPTEIKVAMRERAAAVVSGCEYIELRNMPGLSTTQYLEYLYKNIGKGLSLL